MPRNAALYLLLAVALVSSFTVAAAAPASPARPYRAVLPQIEGRELQSLFPSVTVADPVIRWMADQVERDTVRKYDGDLSGAWPVMIGGTSYTIKTRMSSTDGLQMAATYAGDHLRGLGLAVEEHVWGPPTTPNVIGEKTGGSRSGDIYMITAHLDDVGTAEEAPGADDNASGSTAVLVAADVLSQFNWDCTLRFALWTGEEQGLRGSKAYAERAKERGENLVGVLNLDMIGWNTPYSAPEIDLHAKSSMPGTVDLANQMASVVGAYGLELVPEVQVVGIGSSDHVSFWNNSYNSILAIEDYYPDEHDFDPYYHTASDKVDTLDLAYFTEYVKAAVAETAHMANCLVTGTLQGSTLASHDNSPIANAAVDVTDSEGRLYRLHTGPDGQYDQAVPPGTYSASVTAYGYTGMEALGISISANSSSSHDFELAPATPAATAAVIAIDTGEVRLTWPHVSPDTAYEVHRSGGPYFEPVPGTRLATLDANHPPALNETLTHRDAESSVGDADSNHYYAVLGMNAAGSSGFSGRTGEFDFRLEPGTNN